MLSCMIWRAIPYYVHLDYRNREINDNFMDEIVIIDLPVYKISEPRVDSVKISDILVKNNEKIKKKKLIEILEGERLIDDSLSPAAKHNRLKVLLNPLVKVKYLGRQSNVVITDQGKNTKIFG